MSSALACSSEDDLPASAVFSGARLSAEAKIARQYDYLAGDQASRPPGGTGRGAREEGDSAV